MFLDFFLHYMKFEGKESITRIKRTGEASSIGKRLHCEKADVGDTPLHACVGQSPGSSTGWSHPLPQ